MYCSSYWEDKQKMSCSFGWEDKLKMYFPSYQEGEQKNRRFQQENLAKQGIPAMFHVKPHIHKAFGIKEVRFFSIK